MKIRASDWYFEHGNRIGRCDAGNCERFYCSGKTHRLLYRTCESVKDRGDDGWWYSGECPACHREYENEREIRLHKEWEAQNAKTA